jgi:phosphatidyl-myo-inositol alpha-mannosyltransferase
VRILHLDPDDLDNPMSGGGPIRNFEICRRLARRHEITVLTPTFPGCEREVEREGVKYRRLGRRIGEHGSSHHITFYLSLPRAVRQGGYDLLVEDFMPPASATLNPLFARAPVVASVQWFYARALSQQLRMPFHLGERYGVRLYRNFIVLTASMQRRIAASVPGATCRIIPNGVDDDLFALPPGVGSTILYLGRVDFAQKGVDLLLRAYAKLRREGRPRLVLAGHYAPGAPIAETLGPLGLTEDVTVLGKVPAQARAQLFAAARFVCVPSREETFGMVIAEACAAGKPVVVFDRAPMNEIADRSGAIAVPAFDVEAYAAAMQALIDAPACELLRRGESCRERVLDYRWDSIAASQEAFYLEVADARRAAGPNGRNGRR